MLKREAGLVSGFGDQQLERHPKWKAEIVVTLPLPCSNGITQVFLPRLGVFVSRSH